jgi:hypothetical protein
VTTLETDPTFDPDEELGGLFADERVEVAFGDWADED